MKSYNLNKIMPLNQATAVLSMCRELPITCVQQKKRTSVTCLDQIQNAIESGVKKLGYEYVRYSYWVKDVLNRGIETNAFSVNISNFPSDWERYYNEQSLYLYDPIVRVIQDNASTDTLIHGTWNDAYIFALKNPLGETNRKKEDYTRNLKELIARAREHNLVSGYYYSWGDNLRHIIVSLSSPNDDADAIATNADFINSLHSIAMLTNQAIQMTGQCDRCTKSVRVDGGDPIMLSEAELTILKLFYKYKKASRKQIAEKYGKSIDTVNHHLKSIRRKLKITGASGHFLATYASELNLL